MKKDKGISLGRKITAIFLVMLIVSTAAVGIFGYLMYRNEAVTQGAQRVLAIAQSVAAGIDGDAMEAALDEEEKDDAWYRAKSLVDGTLMRTDVKYLYVLDATYDAAVVYYMEGFDPANTEEEEYDFLTPEAADIFADEMYDTLRTGQASSTELYRSGEFGMMVSGFAPIFGSDGRVVGVVGIDLGMNEVTEVSGRFGFLTILIVLVLAIPLSLLCLYLIRRMISKPIGELTTASQKLTQGDMDVNLTVASRDEIGRLAIAFNDMAASTNKQVQVLQQVAAGDLTVEVHSRSDKDILSHALTQLIENLNRMFAEIHRSADLVSASAAQVRGDAQQTLERVGEQEQTAGELAASMAEVASKTSANTEMSQRSARLAEGIQQSAAKGTNQMEQMLAAVQDIDEASQAIGRVIQVIDDIASQTNILALNAAVEAARAGQHGKGFAVVADEVRNLAAKSARSAKDSSALVKDTLEKTSLGVEIAHETSASLEEIVTGITESSRIAEEIARASGEQSEAIGQIEVGIETMAAVVRQNSTTAQQSAAASADMGSQAQTLEQLLAQFRLKGDGRSNYMLPE